MNTTEILSAIDEEISRLTQARSLLGGVDATVATQRSAPSTAGKRGRPKGSKNRTTSFTPSEFKLPNRRTMSPEGKARIAAAQRARWARQNGAGQETRTARRSAAKNAAPVKNVAKGASASMLAPKKPVPAKKAVAKPAAAKKAVVVNRAPIKRVSAKKAPLKIATGTNFAAKAIPSEKAAQKKVAYIKAVPPAKIPNGVTTGIATVAE